MKKISMLLVALLVVCLAVCGVAEAKPYAGQTLTISNFSFNAELLQKNIYDPFMEMTGCELVVDMGGNAQRVTKITESPADYDVVIIGDMFVKQLMDAGVIDTLDSSKLTNLTPSTLLPALRWAKATARLIPSTAWASSMTALSAISRSRALPTCGIRSWKAASPSRT